MDDRPGIRLRSTETTAAIWKSRIRVGVFRCRAARAALFQAPRVGGPRGLWLLLCLALYPFSGAAEPLLLRSGEHPDFTRITVALPAGTTWQMRREDEGYLVSLSDPDVSFDLSRVFDRIPRTRLDGISEGPDPGSLALTVTCDCHAVAFRDGPDLLVIDLRSGPSPEETPFDAPPSQTIEEPPEQPSAGQRPRGAYDWTTAFYPAAQEPLLGRHAPAPAAVAPPDAFVRDLLLNQMERAASQGLIETPTFAPVPHPTEESAAAPSTATERLSQEELPDPFLNLRIEAETAIDRALRSGDGNDLADASEQCLPDALFAVQDWGSGEDPALQIATLNQRLIGEFDAADPQTVESLARLYLHLGHGAEARATLRAFPGSVPDADILADLARIVDNGGLQAPARFSAMTGCDGAVALWALLAQVDPTAAHDLEESALLRAFSALPLHLRRHLGPHLAQRLLEVGSVDTAHSVREAISRASGDHGTNLVMVSAGLDLAQGRTEAALRKLGEVIEGNDVHAAEALALLVETRLANDETIAPGMIGDLAARAFETRGTDLGARLGRLEALALASANRFDEGFAVRDRLRTEPGDAGGAVTQELFRLLVERGSDTAFLNHTFGDSTWHGGAFLPDLRLALARRFLDLGFASAALRALPPPEAGNPAEIRLMAHALLQLDDPQEAFRLVANQEGNDAARLRGESLARLGRNADALAEFRDAAIEEPLARAAWLSGDEAAIAAYGTEAQRAAVLQRRGPTAPSEIAGDAAGGQPGISDDPMIPALQEDSPGGSEEAGMLSRSRALLDQSRETRAILEDLLATQSADGAP